MLPPFVNDTLNWLRSETVLPVRAPAGAPGEPDAAAAENPAAGAYAAPFAAALIGGIAALALLLFWVLNLPTLAVAAATLASLAVISGARMESGLVRAGNKLAAADGAGAAALVLILMVEVAALSGLVALDALRAALALIAAVTLGVTASLAFRLTQPATAIEEIGDLPRRSHGGALQGLSIVAVVIAAVLLLPVYRIGPTAAAFVGGLAAFVAVIAVAKNQTAADVPDFSRAAGKTVEAVVLIAILAFIRYP